MVYWINGKISKHEQMIKRSIYFIKYQHKMWLCKVLFLVPRQRSKMKQLTLYLIPGIDLVYLISNNRFFAANFFGIDWCIDSYQI